MDANRITNKTISKLTADEIGALGMYDIGVYTYKGTLKKRRQGYKTEKVNDTQTNFVAGDFTVQFISIQQTLDRPEWAMRVYDNRKEEYVHFYSVLAGCDFLK